VAECDASKGYWANMEGTTCIDTTEFPTIGPIFTILSGIATLVVLIIKYCVSRETEVIPSLIAILSGIEWAAIIFSIPVAFAFEQPRIGYIALVSLIILYLINIYNDWYVRIMVVGGKDAVTYSKVSESKLKKLEKEFKRDEARKDKYKKAITRHKEKRDASRKQKKAIREARAEGSLKKHSGMDVPNNYSAYEPLPQKAKDGDFEENEGGEIELSTLKIRSARKVFDLDCLSDPGPSLSQRGSDQECDSSDEYDSSEATAYDGGQKEPSGKGQREFHEGFMIQKGISLNDDGDYVVRKEVEDLGFKRWRDTFPTVYTVIRWFGILCTFKVYRFTYSYFLRKRQFLVLYQKKKFKKNTILLTLLSMFAVELPNIIAAVVGMSELKFSQQIAFTAVDNFVVSLVLILIEFYEIASLDKIMKTANTKGHQQRKSAAACESSQDDSLDDEESEDDDYPDWKIMLKNVHGNPKLFHTDDL
jgi:hypothetical protein